MPVGHWVFPKRDASFGKKEICVIRAIRVKNFLSSSGGHGQDLYCLNNGFIVQTMLPFHKCCRIYEIKDSVISEIRVRALLKKCHA